MCNRRIFYENCEDSMRPAGCGQPESRMHFIQCTTRYLQSNHIKRREEFKQTHSKLKTAKVIYEGFMGGDIPYTGSDEAILGKTTAMNNISCRCKGVE